MNQFTSLDWTITVLSLVATLWVGLLARRHVGRLEDYLVANRGMGLYVGTASLVSTEIGIITYMYQAQFGFVAGFSAFAVGLVTIAVCAVVGRTGFVIDRLRAMEIMTVPEYFERRYSKRVRVVAGALMAFGGSLNLGIFPIIEARFVSIVTGIDARYVTWTMAALLLLALAYTAVGGMLSLILTNYVQYVLLAFGTVVVSLVFWRTASWAQMRDAVTTHLGGQGFDPLADFGLAFLAWQVLLWTALMTVWQSVAMRAFSAKDAETGRKVFSLTSVLFLGRAVLPMTWGIAALAFYGARGAPIGAESLQGTHAQLQRDFQGELDKGNLGPLLARVEDLERRAGPAGAAPSQDRAAAAEIQRQARSWREEIGLVAMPWMVVSVVPTGLLGLIMAGMLAASVSTYAGYFLGWSAIIAQDIVRPCLRNDLSPRAQLLLTRVAVVGLTVFIMIWSLGYDLPGPAYFYLQVTANLFMAPTLVTVVAGLYWKGASALGALLAFVLGALASLGYLVPSLGLTVATAGNLTWVLAALGLVVGSLVAPPPRPGEAA